MYFEDEQKQKLQQSMSLKPPRYLAIYWHDSSNAEKIMEKYAFYELATIFLKFVRPH